MSPATRQLLGKLALLVGVALTARGLLITDHLKDIYLYGGLSLIVVGGSLVAGLIGKGQR